MARFTFSRHSSDYVIQTPQANTDLLLIAAPNLVGTVWSAVTGGTQYTDLLVGGVAATTITTDASGARPEFQGPDAVPVVWLDFNGGNGPRYAVFGTEAITNNATAVTSVTAADTTITVAGTATAPTVKANVGTAAGTVASGNDARFAGSAAGTAGASLSATDATTTNSRTPSGTAGGDLGGTYPSPTVAKVAGATVPGTAPTAAGQALVSSSVSAAAWTMVVNSISGGSSKVSIGGTSLNPTIDVAVANLGTGTPSASKYLDGSGAWSTPPGGGGRNWISAIWCLPGANLNAAISNESTTANTLYMVPFYVATAGTVTDLAISVGTAATAGSLARLGIYSKDATGTGWTLVNDTGTVAIDTTGDKQLNTLSISLASAGVYGVAVLCQAACSLNSRTGSFPLFGPQSTPFSTNVSNYMSVAQTYGALPATAAAIPTGGYTSSMHRAMVKLA